MEDSIHKSKDHSMKMVLDEPEMLISFLKKFVPIDVLKDVRPSDVEDIPTRHLNLISEQKDSDTIKRINLKGDSPLFVIAIVEHESQVNFRASFKMLLYTALILEKYEKEVIKKARKESKNKNINPTLLKDFKYPPVLPIVFYDGKTKWTAKTNFLNRTEMHDIFKKYIPKFEYELVDLNKYSIEDLTKFGDLLSLFLILDKVKNPDELGGIMSSLPKDYIDKVSANVPDNLRELLSKVVLILLTKIDVPKDEIAEVTDRIKERGVAEMFNNFNAEGYSVRETRREAKAEVSVKIARKLIARKRPIEEIIEDTELTREEVEKLLQEHNSATSH
ncbi:MAG: Rpn family recombination-promoting nuclease/putative transposase [Oscillospiraceae bacterium]|nr:Rpn family recombination-promoting nuclease/putative transposase [Oscillospiraceae bacterium]MCL2279520.1 Rpn family recombination-promoting nuclease/putative transposase [Oscillospiraceae bacterium]